MVGEADEPRSVSLADLYTAAWQRVGGATPMPDWFPDAAETLELFHQHHTIPRDYMVFDVETAGEGRFDFHEDLIVEVGWAIVRDTQLVDAQSLILDWTRDPRIDQADLQHKLEHTRAEMAAKGKHYPFTYERLATEGVPWQEGLHVAVTLLYDAIQRGETLVGHNAWRFDRGMINGHSDRFGGGYQLPWRSGGIIDTGLIQKAMAMNRPPYCYETLDQWYTRVDDKPLRGVTWSLHQVCIPRYRLVERYGLDMSQAHTAAFDCQCTHLLLESYRELITALCGANV